MSTTTIRELSAPVLEEIQEAQRRLRGTALRTPLVRLDAGDSELWLKLENLQPIGSFKIRGAGNAILSTPRADLVDGVYTASAGNMAQGVGYVGRKLNLTSTMIVPEHAPEAKLAAIRRLGGRIVKVSFDRWWQTLMEREYPGMEGRFIHPVADRQVMAGNGTIGLEILEDLPDVDSVLVPYGGGGLSVGIASAVRALKPETRIYACEVETAAPLRASLAAKKATTSDYTPSFVDGIGGKSVLAEMWPLASTLLDGSLVVSLAEIASAIRLLVERNRVVAEGAGAAAVAAALKGVSDARKIVCVVSGGNIDPAKLAKVLLGEVPTS
jgi:threonine dehydratase